MTRVTYQCRLCNDYGIVLRMMHLIRKHNAARTNGKAQSRVNLLDAIFIPSHKVEVRGMSQHVSA